MNEDKVVEKKSILGSVYSFICDHYVLVGTVTVVIICSVAYWYFSGPLDFTKAGVPGSNVENYPDQGVGDSLQSVQENLDLKMDVECENIENTVEQIFDSFSGSSSSEELINLLSLNDNLPKLVEQYPNALSNLAPTVPDFSDLVTNQGIAMAQDPSLFPIWVPLTFIEKGLVIISESGILSYKCVDVALFCTKIQFALYKHLLDTGIYDASIHGSNFQVFVDNGFVDIPLDANFDWDIVLGVLLAF